MTTATETQRDAILADVESEVEASVRKARRRLEATAIVPRYTRDQAVDRANYVEKIVHAALEPGGPLYDQLSDLVGIASGHARDAAGVPDQDDDDRSTDWTLDYAKVDDEVAHTIATQIFKAAMAYFGHEV